MRLVDAELRIERTAERARCRAGYIRTLAWPWPRWVLLTSERVILKVRVGGRSPYRG
jgi:hypothetical protein